MSSDVADCAKSSRAHTSTLSVPVSMVRRSIDLVHLRLLRQLADGAHQPRVGLASDEQRHVGAR